MKNLITLLILTCSITSSAQQRTSATWNAAFTKSVVQATINETGDL